MNSRFFILLLLLFNVFTKAYSEVSNDSIWSQIWAESDHQEIQSNLNTSTLIYKGGLELKSNSPTYFGGLSSLSINKDGSEVLMISDYSSQKKLENQDRSKWHKCQLHFGADNSLAKLSVLTQGQLFHHDKTLVAGEIESIANIKKFWYISFDNKYGL